MKVGVHSLLKLKGAKLFQGSRGGLRECQWAANRYKLLKISGIFPPIRVPSDNKLLRIRPTTITTKEKDIREDRSYDKGRYVDK